MTAMRSNTGGKITVRRTGSTNPFETINELRQIIEEQSEHIASLEEDYAELETLISGKSQPWVSVEDRLPEQYTDVIVLYDFGRMGINWTNKENEFIEHKDCKVTHWMPLPQAPENKDDT